MPTYEFRCPEGHEFEKFYRSIGTAPIEVTCPVCGKVAERRMSAGGGLVFKGSGFYITDYGKDGKKPQTAPAAESGSTETPSKNEAPAKAETKTPESKPGKDANAASSKPAEKPASTTKKKSGE